MNLITRKRENLLNNRDFPSLTPMFEGFEKLFDRTVWKQVQGFPYYDVIAKHDGNYEVVVALAGYNEDELEVIEQSGNLNITGVVEETEKDDTEYIHRGIAKRSFELSFKLNDTKVNNVDFRNGQLHIQLKSTRDENVVKWLSAGQSDDQNMEATDT